MDIIPQDICKAQDLFHKMNGSCGPKCFKKLLTQAIDTHWIGEFYPVVVQAELSAALAISVREKQKDPNFNFPGFLQDFFGMKPDRLLHLSTGVAAGIMGKAQEEVDDLFRALGYHVDHGRVTNYERPCSCAA